ncbi:transposable element Tcb1 transposase [Trichonephila clavipes]|nr:transposable element Tcb1 transposase [Trichonephila clavipes]
MHKHGDHAQASSTTLRITMSDTSERMDISPSRLAQVATCKKLRDTVTGISALHKSLHEVDGRSPSPRNSYTELYRTTIIRRKEDMVSELKTLPPCTRLDCQDHKIPSTSVDEEIIFEISHPENENNIKNNCKPNKKKLSKKRKNKAKESTEEFIFPQKTARPISPTSTQDPIETNNNFSDLEQDVEHPLSTQRQVTTELVTPKKTLPHPIMLKVKDNLREQSNCISKKFPNIRNRLAKDVVKMHTNDPEEYRALLHFLKSNKEFEFYVIDRKKIKPIKAVIKGLPSSSKINGITNDLAEVGFQIESCTQLTSKRTKKSLPYFLVILPRNNNNSKIFDITKLGYLQPKIGTAFSVPIKKKNFVSKWTKDGISLANVVSGEIPSQTPPENENNNENNKEDSPRGFLSQDSNSSDLAQVLELFNIISSLDGRRTDQVDHSECAVRNCWEQWTREGTHARKTGSGATRKTTRREDRRIVWQALVDPTVTRSTIRADVGVAIVPHTISRHLAEANLKSKRPFRALPLTPEHRQLRLQWCQARSMWNITDWQTFVFSDESRFVLGTENNRVRVWRALTTFQQDNVHPHTARVFQDFLRHFQTLPWPAHFPDLSPVEHVWDQLKRQMPSCHSVHDLELAVQDLWTHLPQDNISIRVRCQQVLEHRENIKKEAELHRQRLLDAYEFQEFRADAQEMSAWIAEKSKLASDLSQKDSTTNLLYKMKRQKTLEAEISANEERLRNTCSRGQAILNKEPNSSYDSVEPILEDLSKAWNTLCDLLEINQQTLKTAIELRDFTQSAENALKKLDDISRASTSTNLGRDLRSVKSLIKDVEPKDNDIIDLKLINRFFVRSLAFKLKNLGSLRIVL